MLQTIALYARVSSDKQHKERTIESQIASLKEYAESNDYKIEKDLVFIDNGVSGASLIRPALDALRDKAVQGEVEKVLVFNPDRLARKYAHQLILMEEFQRLGVEIIFANRKIASNPEDQLLLQMQGIISEYEREKIMERSRRGKLHKAKQKKVSVFSRAPYGYVYIPLSEEAEARYEIHQEEAEVVRKIFHMLVNQKMSIGSIASELTKEQIPTRTKAGYWARSTIWGILNNPAYMGKAAYGKKKSVPRKKATKHAYDNSFYSKRVNNSVCWRPKEEWIYIPVPAIISEETFAIVQEQLEENKRLSSRNNKKNEYLLNGLLRCKGCGYALSGKPTSNSPYNRRYYRCMGQEKNKHPKGTCPPGSVRVDVLDDLVWEQIKKLIEEPELVFQEYTNRVMKKNRDKKSFEEALNKKRREIQQQEIEKERLLDLYQSGIISLSEIEKRLKSIRAKIKRLQDQATLLAKEGERELRQLQLIEQFEVFKEKLATNLSNLNFEERKKLVRLLVEEVIVDRENKEILIRHIIPLEKSFPLCTWSHSHTFPDIS